MGRRNWHTGLVFLEDGGKSGGRRDGAGPLGFSATVTPVTGMEPPAPPAARARPLPQLLSALLCALTIILLPGSCKTGRKGLWCHNGSSFPWFPGDPSLRLRINLGLGDVLVHWWP